jgi:hypothetical protein
MNIYAHHDGDGTIHSMVAVNAPDGAGMALAPRPGELVSEIEGVTLKSGVHQVEALQEIARTHKVSTPLHRCKLTKMR